MSAKSKSQCICCTKGGLGPRCKNGAIRNHLCNLHMKENSCKKMGSCEQPTETESSSKERLDRLEKERLEKQRAEKERLDRLEKQRAEKERLDRLEKQRAEKERLDRLEKERLEKEHSDRLRLANERLGKLLLEQKRLEKERLEKERLEKERLEKERLEKERLEKERLEKERLEKERLEKERLEKERLEKERLEKERLEKERLEKERLEKERLEKERLEKERLEKERLEKERLEKERLEKERLEKERLEKERLEKEKPPVRSVGGIKFRITTKAPPPVLVVVDISHMKLDEIRPLIKENKVSDEQLWKHPEILRMLEEHQIEQACLYGWIPLVKKIMDNKKHSYNWNRCLKQACKSGVYNLVVLIASQGAINWNRALLYACYHNQSQIMTFLAEKTSSASKWIFYGACWGGHLLIVKKIKIQDQYLPKAMYYACRGGHRAVVDELLKMNRHRNQIQIVSQGVLGAARGGHFELVQMMLDKGASVDSLSPAGRGGEMEIIDYLINHLKNVSINDWNEVVYGACRGGHLHVIEQVSQRTDFSKFDKYVISDLIGEALHGTHFHVVDWFISHHLFDIKDLGSEDVLRGCGYHLEAFNWVFKKGITTNKIGWCGLLNGGCAGGDLRIVTTAIAHGADGWDDAMTYAQTGGNMVIVMLLMDKVAKTKENWNDLLNDACRSGYPEIADVFISKFEVTDQANMNLKPCLISTTKTPKLITSFYSLSRGGKNNLYRTRQAIEKESLKDITDSSEMSFDLASLICSNLRMSHSRECTTLGNNLATAVIRIACERIFNVPEQSIMELPVNSIDSYNRRAGITQTIGKFGMGFFSIMYWLIGHPKRSLIIESTYHSGDRLLAYYLYLRVVEGQLNATITARDPDEVTGTKIMLFVDFDRLDNETIEQMNYQLNRLRDVDGALIKIKTRSDDIEMGDKTSANLIEVLLYTRHVDVVDYAEGIPIDVVITSLLVPSSSTKTIQASTATLTTTTTSPDKTRYMKGTEPVNCLAITVNNIVIVQVMEDSDTPGYEFVVAMPHNTRLPVSRDDIILESGSPESANLEKRLLMLIDQMIERERTVVPILKLINKYVLTSNQQELNAIQHRIYLNLQNRSDCIFVPKREIYSILQGLYPKTKIVFHSKPVMYNAEKQLMLLLKDQLHNDIYHLKSIFYAPLKETNFTTGQLTQIICVSDDYRGDPDWVSNLSIASKTFLFPYKKNTTLISLYEKEIEVFRSEYIRTQHLKLVDDSLLTTIYSLLMTYHAIFDRYTKNSLKIDDLFRIILLFDLYVETTAQTVDFVRHINGKLAQIVFDASYGSELIINHEFKTFIGGFAGFHYTTVKPYPTTGRFRELQRRIFYYGVNLWPKRTHEYYTMVNICSLEIFTIYGYNIESHHQFILDHYHNEAEVIVFYQILQDISLRSKPTTDSPTMILQEIRARASPKDLNKMVEANLLSYTTRNEILTKVCDPVIQTHTIFSSIRQNLLRTTTLALPANFRYHFTVRSLIAYVFNFEITKNWLREVHEFHTHFNDYPVKLQIVEIAVNEGTTKDYARAVITELVQNSIDAIRSTGKPENHKIHIKIDGNLTVTDSVGISSDSSDIFLSLMIPFLSTKTVDDPLVTGEMGSGFFNVYRHPWCQSVNIKTVKNGHLTFIRATPVVKDKRVIDVDYQIERTDFTGPISGSTTVEVVLNKQAVSDLAHLLTNAQMFTKNYLAYTDIDITLNGKSIPLKKELVYRSQVGQIYVSQDVLVPSMVMTNFVPFQSLEMLLTQIPVHVGLKENTTTSVIINFNKEFYKPVQSRTKIKFEGVDTSVIQKFLSDGLYMATAYLYKEGRVLYPNLLIDHSTSKSKMDQLKLVERVTGALPVISDISNILADYEIPPHQSTELKRIFGKELFTLGQYINWLIDNDEKRTHITSEIENQSIVKKVLVKWFKGKNATKTEATKIVVMKKIESTSPPQKLQKIQKPQGKEKETMVIPFTVLQPFVDIYWDIIARLIIHGGLSVGNITDINRARPLIVYGKDEGNMGSYHPKTHTLLLNLEYFNPEQILQELIKISATNDSTAVRTNSILRELFSTNEPTPTLIHELLHAVLNEAHLGSSHPSLKFQIHGKTQTASFNLVALEMYKLACEEGLITRYLEGLKIFFKPFPNPPQKLEQKELVSRQMILKTLIGRVRPETREALEITWNHQLYLTEVENMNNSILVTNWIVEINPETNVIWHGEDQIDVELDHSTPSKLMELVNYMTIVSIKDDGGNLSRIFLLEHTYTITDKETYADLIKMLNQHGYTPK
jgi:hypothetical protein